MTTIQCKYNSVLKLRVGQLGVLLKYTSRLEEKKLVSNRTDLIRTSNKYCFKYNCVVSQPLTLPTRISIPHMQGMWLGA